MVLLTTIEMDNQTGSNVLAQFGRLFSKADSVKVGKGRTGAGEGPVNRRRCRSYPPADPSILGSPCSRSVLYPHLV